MALVWFVIQVAIVSAVVVFNIEANPDPSPPAAAIVVGSALAFAFTFTVVKTIDAVRLTRRYVGDLRNRRLQRANKRIPTD